MLRAEKFFDSKQPFPNRRKLVLPFDDRKKSRQSAILEDGETVQLFLPRGSVLRGGDLLQATDGTAIEVVAAPEKILYVRGTTPFALIRAAYHLGNRHTAVELGDGFLKLERDPVLKEMLQRLGMRVEERSEPFDPEPGAYGGGHHHGDEHEHSEEHALAQRVYAEYHSDHGLRGSK